MAQLAVPVISRGLLEALDEEERRAVVLHEEGHLRQRHPLLLALGRWRRPSARCRPRRWVLPARAIAAGVLLALLAVTQVLAGLAVAAAAHHLVGLGAAATCPVARPPVAPVR